MHQKRLVDAKVRLSDEHCSVLGVEHQRPVPVTCLAKLLATPLVNSFGSTQRRVPAL